MTKRELYLIYSVALTLASAIPQSSMGGIFASGAAALLAAWYAFLAGGSK